MTNIQFFEAYKLGQRYFLNLDFEYIEGFSNRDFSNVIFENCFLDLDFRHSNLTNAQFISSNIKEIDLRYSNLTNALMKNCLVESVLFKGAIVKDFKFIDNYSYGATLGQTEFDRDLINSDAYILTKELSEIEFKRTIDSKLYSNILNSEIIVDIWNYYVKQLVYENIISDYVLKNKLIEKIYRNNNCTFDYILLTTNAKNIFIVIVVKHGSKTIFGHYKLDIEKDSLLD